jgi:hypothetical protein
VEEKSAAVQLFITGGSQKSILEYLMIAPPASWLHAKQPEMIGGCLLGKRPLASGFPLDATTAK